MMMIIVIITIIIPTAISIIIIVIVTMIINTLEHVEAVKAPEFLMHARHMATCFPQQPRQLYLVSLWTHASNISTILSMC